MQQTAVVVALTMGLAFRSVPYDEAVFSGSVKTTTGAVIPFAFVGLLTTDFQLVASDQTDVGGMFSISASAPTKYVVVQPPASENSEGLGIYAYEPRLYLRGDASAAELRLPPAGCLIVKAYDARGKLLRWEDFVRRGAFGGQFLYPTRLDDCIVPAAVWPVFDADARAVGAPREKGFPALVVPAGEPIAVQVLFWDAPGYGRIQLRADNAEQGFRVAKAGESIVVELNVEFARTALAALHRRSEYFSSDARSRIAETENALQEVLKETDPVKRAAAADEVLARALNLRDELEIGAAQDAVAPFRKGILLAHVTDGSGAPVKGASVRIRQKRRDFRFGVFQGGRYDERTWRKAREAGFELATLLPAWGWSDAKKHGPNWSAYDQFMGITALGRLGFTVKAHGVVWLQDVADVLPENVRTMPLPDLRAAALAQQQALLTAFGDRIAIWEAINEPATTNAVHMPRPDLIALLGDAAKAIKALPGTTSLVNNPHEFDYGRKYLFYKLAGTPSDDHNLTYAEFLTQAQAAGALEAVDVIGLQFYPGSHLNESLGGIEGPAVPPAWLVDTLDRYTRFARPIHITEFSIPGEYRSDWKAGYWREPWNPDTQADYAEIVFKLVFGHPQAQSITWWDISDKGSSVVAGGLLDAFGNPRPVYDRLKQLLADWTTDITTETDVTGVAVMSGFGGHYEAEVRLPDGRTIQRDFHLKERETLSVTFEVGKT